MEMAENKLKLLVHLPTEIVEEILLNLPMKSLLRFTSVSEEWNSIIYDSWFFKRYRRRVALPDDDREKILLTSPEGTCSSILLPSTETETEIEYEEIVCPFHDNPRLIASCKELVLASCDDESLFLWNPSMMTPSSSYKRLSEPSTITGFYGLGYDSVAEDFKILKIGPHSEVEMYSLSSDSWRDIPNFCADTTHLSEKSNCVFVGGKFHWMFISGINDYSIMCAQPTINTIEVHIIYFDLSTEKWGEVAVPNYSRTPYEGKICVLKGMLCLSLFYYAEIERDARSDIWVMEDYGVAMSWTKMFTITSFRGSRPNGYSLFPYRRIVPLYIYGNGKLLIRATRFKERHGILVYNTDFETTPKLETLPRDVYLYGENHSDVVHGFLYADSVVAPAMWSTTN